MRNPKIICAFFTLFAFFLTFFSCIGSRPTQPGEFPVKGTVTLVGPAYPSNLNAPKSVIIKTSKGGGIVKVDLKPGTTPFTMASLPPGTYQIVPEAIGYSFDPPNFDITISDDTVRNADFNFSLAYNKLTINTQALRDLAGSDLWDVQAIGPSQGAGLSEDSADIIVFIGGELKGSYIITSISGELTFDSIRAGKSGYFKIASRGKFFKFKKDKKLDSLKYLTIGEDSISFTVFASQTNQTLKTAWAQEKRRKISDSIKGVSPGDSVEILIENATGINVTLKTTTAGKDSTVYYSFRIPNNENFSVSLVADYYQMDSIFKLNDKNKLAWDLAAKKVRIRYDTAAYSDGEVGLMAVSKQFYDVYGSFHGPKNSQVYNQMEIGIYKLGKTKPHDYLKVAGSPGNDTIIPFVFKKVPVDSYYVKAFPPRLFEVSPIIIQPLRLLTSDTTLDPIRVSKVSRFIRGKVIDDSGLGISRMELLLTSGCSGDSPQLLFSKDSTESNPTGRGVFEFNNLDPECSYHLKVQETDFYYFTPTDSLAIRGQPINLEDSSRLAFNFIGKPRPDGFAVIRGTFWDNGFVSGGVPAPFQMESVMVLLKGPTDLFFSDTEFTDKAGFFKFDSLKLGKFRIFAKKAGYFLKIPVAARSVEADGIEFDLPSRGDTNFVFSGYKTSVVKFEINFWDIERSYYLGGGGANQNFVRINFSNSDGCFAGGKKGKDTVGYSIILDSLFVDLSDSIAKNIKYQTFSDLASDSTLAQNYYYKSLPDTNLIIGLKPTTAATDNGWIKKKTINLFNGRYRFRVYKVNVTVDTAATCTTSTDSSIFPVISRESFKSFDSTFIINNEDTTFLVFESSMGTSVLNSPKP